MRVFKYFEETLISIIRHARNMYFEVFEVSNHNFGELREEPKIQAECTMWDYGIRDENIFYLVPLYSAVRLGTALDALVC